MAGTKSRGVVPAVLISVIAFMILIGSGHFEQRTVPPVPAPLQGIQPVIHPNTFRIETPAAFRLEPLDKLDSRCNSISARVPELGYSQSFNMSELKAGASSEISPSKIGTFHMLFACNGKPIGQTSLSVVIGGELSPAANNRKWLLTAGAVIYRDDSSFTIPVMITAEQRRGVSTWVPSSVPKDVHFYLRDSNGQLSGKTEIIIDRNTAISNPRSVAFPPGAKYSLIAFNKDDGTSSNEIQLDWSKIGPKVELVAFPNELTMYAVPVSSAKANVYLAHDGAQITPSATIDVLMSPPPTLRLEPDSRLALSPTTPIASLHATGATSKGKVSLGLSEPQMGLRSEITINVLSPIGFLIAALFAGAIGVLVARNKALFGQKWYLVILEIFCAAVCAFLLYGADILGWFKPVGLGEFTLSILSAVCIGLVGGYLGLAVFKGISALFKLTP